MNIEQLQDVLNNVPNDNITPYGLHKFVNEKLGTNLPPQMFYNYVAKGYITTIVDDDDKIWIEPKEVRRWVERYALRNIVTL